MKMEVWVFWVLEDVRSEKGESFKKSSRKIVHMGDSGRSGGRGGCDPEVLYERKKKSIRPELAPKLTINKTSKS